MKIKINDTTTHNITSRIMLDNGYMKVPANVARSGIQEYLAEELGITDRQPDDIIKVMRLPQDVFNEDSLKTYKDADVTDNHPDDQVNANTYSSVSVGHCSSVGIKDGDFVKCNLIIKDKNAIDSINNGKVQISAGYTADYVEANDNDDYDFKQENIKINHIALVERGRAGAQVKLFDSQKAETMKTKVVLDGKGKSVEIEDKASAILINDTIETLITKNKELLTDVEKLTATVDGLKEFQEQNKLQTSDEVIKNRITEISKATKDAIVIAGSNFSCDSLNVNDIKKTALGIKRPNVKWDDKSEAYIDAAFDQALEYNEEKVIVETSNVIQNPKTTDSLYNNVKHINENAWKKTLGM